jgi:hypothetical protein
MLIKHPWCKCYTTFFRDLQFSYLASAFVRLGWKSLPGTNALAYYENSYITDKKSFITLAPGPDNDRKRLIRRSMNANPKLQL